MSAAGRALSKALENTEDWTGYSEYHITHVPSGQVFWVGNGAWFFDGYKPRSIEHSIGLLERHWLYFKARKIIAKFASPKPRPDLEVVARFEAAAKNPRQRA